MLVMTAFPLLQCVFDLLSRNPQSLLLAAFVFLTETKSPTESISFYLENFRLVISTQSALTAERTDLQKLLENKAAIKIASSPWSNFPLKFFDFYIS